MNQYYQIPLSFKALMSGESRRSYYCSLKESINQNIILIICSKFDHFRYDPSYGCKIWDTDFEIPSEFKWTAQIETSIKEALEKYEKRIEKIEKFDVQLNKDVKVNRRSGQVLNVTIRGTIRHTNDRFEFSETLFFSPYSRQ